MGKITNYTSAVTSGSTRLLGSDPNDSENTKNFTVDSLDTYLSGKRISSVPTAASSTGEAGTHAIDSDYIYVCVATNTWKRVAIATW